MPDNAKAMVLASFAADSFALGPHWIYDTDLILNRFGRPETLTSPLPDSFHQGKGKGQFTHYGDQALWLLKSLANRNGFDAAGFAEDWRSAMEPYKGYLDKASKKTLENRNQGMEPLEAGSDSLDLAGASRIAPLVFLYRNSPDQCQAACEDQTRITHNNPLVIEAASFFGKAALAVLGGKSPADALAELAGEGFENPELDMWFNDGAKSAGRDTVEAIGRFGQMCPIKASFPSTVHLIVKYQEDFLRGMQENVLAGGDSAARGLVFGMLAGAWLGQDAIPGEWLTDMEAYDRINELLNTLRSLQP